MYDLTFKCPFTSIVCGATGVKAFHKYVGKINPRCQFHQHSTSSFYACRSQKRKKIPMTLLYFFTLLGSTSVKAAHKTLVKLTPVIVICDNAIVDALQMQILKLVLQHQSQTTADIQ